MQFSTSPHRPPHLYTDNQWYFITASCQQRARLLVTASHYQIVQSTLHTLSKELLVPVCSWVILSNHYHMLVFLSAGRTLGRLMQRLHGRTARELNLLDRTPGRRVWYSYWDRCIRDPADFSKHMDYIHWNPVRHGYVSEAEHWAHSSYPFSRTEAGEAWTSACWEMNEKGVPDKVIFPVK